MESPTNRTIVASSLLDSSVEKRLRRRCWDNYRDRSKATNDTRVENHVLPREEEEEKNGKSEEKVTEGIDRSRQEVVERLF